MTDPQDKLSPEDMQALAATLQQLKSSGDPRASKLETYMGTLGKGTPKYSEDQYDDSGKTYFPGEKRNIDPATGRTLARGMPGSFEGHPENIGEYVPATAGRAAEGAVDISRGNVAMGSHKIIQAGANAIAPMAPMLAAGAPMMTARALAGGYLGGKAAEGGASMMGATPDQQQLVGDIGNVVGGGVAASGLPRALLETPLKEIAAKHGGTIGDLLDAFSSPVKFAKSKLSSWAQQTGQPQPKFNDFNQAAANNTTFTAPRNPFDPNAKVNTMEPHQELPGEAVGRIKTAIYEAQKAGDTESEAHFRQLLQLKQGDIPQGGASTPSAQMNVKTGNLTDTGNPQRSNLSANQRRLQSPTGSSAPVPKSQQVPAEGLDVPEELSPRVPENDADMSSLLKQSIEIQKLLKKSGLRIDPATKKIVRIQ